MPIIQPKLMIVVSKMEIIFFNLSLNTNLEDLFLIQLALPVISQTVCYKYTVIE